MSPELATTAQSARREVKVEREKMGSNEVKASYYKNGAASAENSSRVELHYKCTYLTVIHYATGRLKDRL